MIIDEGSLRVKWYDPEQHLMQLVKLHAECFPQEEWQAKDFRAFINKVGKNNVLKVLEDEAHRVYGSLLYTLTASTCFIRRVGVLAAFRRKGLATHMVHTLTGPRSPIRCKTFVAKVRESNYPAVKLFHGRLHFKFDPAAPRPKVETSEVGAQGEALLEECYIFAFEKIPVVVDDLLTCKGK